MLATKLAYPISGRSVLGPKRTLLGPSWALLRPSWSLLRPSWGLLRPSWGLLGSSCGHFGLRGLFWQRLAWLKLAPRRGEKRISTSVRFAISIASNIDLDTSWTRFWAAPEAQELPKSVLEAMLGPPWGLLGPSWGLLENLGPSWDRLGAILGPSWVLLGPSWGPHEHLGAILGPSWGHLGAILGPSWVLLGPLGAILGPSWGPCVCLFEQLRYARTSRRAIKVIVFLTCLNSTPHPRISRDCTTRKNATFQHRRAPGPLPMGPRLALGGLHRNQKEGFPLTAYAYGAVYQITARAAMAQNETSKSCEKLAIIFPFPPTKWATSQCINFLKAVPRCVYADRCDTTGPLHDRRFSSGGLVGPRGASSRPGGMREAIK